LSTGTRIGFGGMRQKISRGLLLSEKNKRARKNLGALRRGLEHLRGVVGGVEGGMGGRGGAGGGVGGVGGWVGGGKGP